VNAEAEMQQREQVVAEARKWIGTPYHCQADIRGAGVDCIMLIVRAFVDAGICAPFDPRPYSDEWFLHRSDEHYVDGVLERCTEVQSARPGDIMIFRWGRCYSHGGIVTVANPLTIVHAYAPARRVVEEAVAGNGMLTEPVRRPRFFSYWA
jgi:NlpC/P60 family putative phage cell wall peptidase